MDEHRDDSLKEFKKSSPGNKNKTSASSEGINKVVTFFKNNNKLGIVVLVAVVLVVLVLILKAVGGDSSKEETSSEIIVGSTEETPIDQANYELQKDAIPQLNELVNTYFEAMKNYDAQTYSNIVAGSAATEEKLQKKGEFIEDYQNISCYTKPGLTEGTYVTYVYYEVKFHNVDTLCPALIQLYICTNEDGTMYINAGDLDLELAGYISTVGSDEQVLALKNETERKMDDAIASDEKLSLLIQKLREGVDYTPVVETTAEEPETDVSEMTFEERDEKVLTTNVVRVRSTPTTDSDDNILGKVEMGQELHRIGYNDKWSKITYNGQEAYISSDYVINK